jgi:hypothetical protein
MTLDTRSLLDLIDAYAEARSARDTAYWELSAGAYSDAQAVMLDRRAAVAVALENAACDDADAVRS